MTHRHNPAPTDPSGVDATAPTQGSEGTDAPGTGTPPSRRELNRMRFVSAMIAIVLLGLLYDVWAGPRSAWRYGILKAEAAEARMELAELERKTSRRVWELRAMQQDPVAVQRVVAEELGAVAPGARVYRFDDTDAAPDR